MAGLLTNFLKRVGVLPEFSTEDIMDAMVEDNFYNHRKVVEKLQAEVDSRKESNVKLRTVLQVAKLQSAGTLMQNTFPSTQYPEDKPKQNGKHE